MTTRPTHRPVEHTAAPPQARLVDATAVVTNVVVRAAGVVPARLDLTHVGTAEQQLGLTLGSALFYLRTGLTARAVAEAWSGASVLARSLAPAVAGRRPLVIGPSTVAVMVRLAGRPDVRAHAEPARGGGAVPAVVRVQVGPVTFEVCDATAYASVLRAWRQAARLLGDNPTEDE